MLLATATFRQIDLLIGAEYYAAILSVGQIKLGNNLPVLQKKLLGWVITGRVATSENVKVDQEPVCAIHIEEQSLSEQLTKFWKLEKFDHQLRPFTAVTSNSYGPRHEIMKGCS